MDATEKIQEMMKQRGWSAYKLAKQSGLSEATIGNLIIAMQKISSVCHMS